MNYNAGYYNINSNKNRFNSVFYRIIDYLNNVTIARQQINFLKPYYIDRYADGDIIEIGGYDNFFKSVYDRGQFLNLDIVDGPNIDVVMDAQDMSIINDNSIGSFLCISVLEHANDPILIIKEIYKKLSVNGYAFISVPWLFESHMEPQDYLRFSDSYLEKVFLDIGFEVVEVFPATSLYGCIAHFLQKNVFLKYSIGWFFLLLDFFSNKDSKFAIQHNFFIKKIR